MPGAGTYRVQELVSFTYQGKHHQLRSSETIVPGP